MFRALEPWHLLVLLVVLLLLFGGKKLPDLTRGVAQSMRIFRKEIRRDDDEDAAGQSGQSGQPRPRPEPLEGRIVEGDDARARATEQRRADN